METYHPAKDWQVFKSLGVNARDKGTEGVHEGSIEFARDKSNCRRLLYIPVKLKQRIELCMIDSGTTSDFILVECAKVNTKKVFEDLKLAIELEEGSKLFLKQRAQVKLRLNDWVFRRRIWIVPSLKHVVILDKAWLVDYNPVIN